MVQKAKCKGCEELFTKENIIVTFEGFYCKDCLPEDVNKTFFSLQFSWAGAEALIAFIDGDANVDQFMIIEKVKEKLERQILPVIKGIIENGGEIQESDS